VSKQDDIQAWLTKNEIQDVEAFVPDMAGAARGKLIPATKFGTGELKLPEGIFAQMSRIGTCCCGQIPRPCARYPG
jgi:glutamine synthetase